MRQLTQPSLLLICCLFIMMPGLSGAAAGSLEKDMQDALFQSSVTVLHLQDRIARRIPAPDLFSRLKTLAEDVRVSHLLLAERFRRQEARVSALGATAIERHCHMAETYRRAVEEYLDIVEGMTMVDDLSSPLLERLKTLLHRILPKKKRPIFGALPYRNLDYLAKIPLMEPSNVPAYRGGDKTVTDDDLKGTLLAPVSASIAELAESLDWNPVGIYEWVKNNIETQWYWGCMKGAEETLRQKSGNDADQAALLVALLRAAGYPSRFVRGVVEFFPGIDTARNLTGIDDEREIAAFFRKAGIPSAPVIKGGGIANIRIEHIWVETQVPYANYRGAVIDEHGKTWLGLDTSIKAAGYTYNQPEEIPAEFPLSGFRDSYLETVRDETPLEYLTSEIDGWLSRNQPGMAHERFLRTRTLTVEEMKILPASLQFIQVAVTGEYTELPDELIHTVRFRAAVPGNDDLLDITLPVFSLSNRPVSITYEPETVEDQEIINAYGGLDNTPAYLVSLRPVITVDGERLAVGKGGLPMGSDYTLAMELTSPGGVERITNTHIMGNFSTVGIVSQSAIIPDELPDEEKTAETCLHEMAIGYIDRWNKAEDELASLFHLALARPIPSVVTVGGLVDVTYLLDSPYEFTWKGVFVDADLKTIEATEGLPETNNRLKIFMQLSGLHGSVLENLILEDTLQVDGISTAKLFGLVNSSGVPIITIDKGTVDTLLPALPFDDAVKEDIVNAVNRNFIVRIPQSEIAYEDWTGIGYLKENPETGEAGWMLSGMIAGASTAWSITRWVEKILDRLRHPFSEPPNYDPASACSIVKIDATDRQKNTAGKKLEKRLEVMIRDREGRPVKGALVTFTVIAGGGICGNNETEITAATDYRGLASADLTLGRFTAENPVMWQIAGQTYAQQVGVNIVDVSLANGEKVASPFIAYGFPGEAFRMRKLHQAGPVRQILDFAGFVSVAVEDENGNPLSNCDVTFTAQDAVAVTPTPCVADGDDRTFAMLVKSDNECLKGVPAYDTCRCQGAPCESGTRSITEITNHAGASAHVFMGAVPGADYTVTAVYETLEATFDFATLPFGNCGGAEPPSYQLKLVHVTPADAHGRNIDAARPGAAIPLTARLYYLKEGDVEDEVTFDCSGSLKTCTRIVGTRDYSEYTGFDTASVTFGSQAGIPKGDGIFSVDYIVPPGKNEITIKGNGTITVRKSVTNCLQECRISEQDQADETEVTTFLYGVTIDTPLQYALPVDDNDLLMKDFEIEYTVNPQEYRAGASYLVIFEKDSGDVTPLAYVPVESTGTVTATLTRGMKFDSTRHHEAKVVLNYGSGEPLGIWSEPIRLDLVRVDLDADLDRNGTFDEDDPLEHTFGLALLQNIDDDGLNGILDYEETGENPDEDDLAPIRITAAAQTGKLVLAPRMGGGKIRVWSSPNKGEGTLVIDMTDEDAANDAIEWDMTAAEDPVRVEETYYVEGIEPSTALGDIELELRLEDEEGNETVSDLLKITAIKIDIVPDFDRDGKMTEEDRGKVTQKHPWRIWVNDDNDGNDYIVNGMEDMVDFFPLFLDLKHVIECFPPSDYVYRLTHKDDALSVMEGTALTYDAVEEQNASGAYLNDLDMADTLKWNAVVKIRKRRDSGCFTLSDAELADIRDNKNNVFLFEGRAVSDKPLALEIVSKYNKELIVSYELPLDIVDVKEMFCHKNFRGIGHPDGANNGGDDDRPVAEKKPACMTDENTILIWLHGFKVDGAAAQETFAEVFKRLFHSGFNGTFYGVSWYGNPPPSIAPHYHQAVVNAFNLAEPFSAFISGFKTGERPKTVHVAAHSLGNMLVGVAMEDHDAPIDTYIALDAAVPLEAYGVTDIDESMINVKNWKDYYDYHDTQRKLLASEWHTLFANDDDNRKLLTWRNRLSTVGGPGVYNLFSSTEDVLRKYDDDNLIFDNNLFNFDMYSFVKQEKFKGRRSEIVVNIAGAASPYAGWGYNLEEGAYTNIIPDTDPWGVEINATVPKEPEELGELSDSFIQGLKEKPFFLAEPKDLFDPEKGSAFVDKTVGETSLKDYYDGVIADGVKVRDWLLAEAFPATTLPMGANWNEKLLIDNNINMSTENFMKETKNCKWPSREGDDNVWYHGDYKDVAYPYVIDLYDKLVSLIH